MSARVGILVFPGTNSEEETLRACLAVGLDARLVHWTSSRRQARAFDAYVLAGGFAYEDRVRAGAIAAHDRLMEGVREGAGAGKLVLGICNGAQILLEAGLAPDFEGDASPQAGFARNAPDGRFRSTRVYMKLALEPSRCAILASLPPDAVIPAWASHGEGRLAAERSVLERINARGHLAFVYCDREGQTGDGVVPNGSALGAAAITNRKGNVLAMMPHPERDAWTFMHPEEYGSRADVLAPSGGIELFKSFAAALR